MSESLAESLLKQQKRVREELIPMYQSIGPAAGFAIAMMNAALTRAERATMSGDVVEMIAAHQELSEFKE